MSKKFCPEFDGVNVFGNAEHGLIKHTNMTLDINGATRAGFNPPVDGDTTLIKTGRSRIGRTASQLVTDAAAGLEWRDTAILSSGYHRSYNRKTNGGDIGWNRIIYTDPNSVCWLLEVTSTGSGNSRTYSVNIINEFGKFFGYHAPHRNKDVGSEVIVVEEGAVIVPLSQSSAKDLVQNPDGSKILLHIQAISRVYEVWQIEIAGAGLVSTQVSEDATHGDGITATFSKIRTSADCYDYDNTSGLTEMVTDSQTTYSEEDIQTPAYPACQDRIYNLSQTNTVTTPTPELNESLEKHELILQMCFDELGALQEYKVHLEVIATSERTLAGVQSRVDKYRQSMTQISSPPSCGTQGPAVLEVEISKTGGIVDRQETTNESGATFYVNGAEKARVYGRQVLINEVDSLWGYSEGNTEDQRYYINGVEVYYAAKGASDPGLTPVSGDPLKAVPELAHFRATNNAVALALRVRRDNDAAFSQLWTVAASYASQSSEQRGSIPRASFNPVTKDIYIGEEGELGICYA